MKILQAYIAKTILSSIMLITIMLAGLQLFMLFIKQLDDIGKADYNLFQAALYVFAQLPYQVYLFFPLASLLGCLLGLGTLASHRELIVMRAAGVSIATISFAVVKASLLVIIIVTVIGETLVPKLTHSANLQKIQALNGGQTLQTAHGLWLRSGNDFIFIGKIMPSGELSEVYQFRFDASHKLHLTRKIAKIIPSNGKWQAYGIHETLLTNAQTKANYAPTMPWDVTVKPNILRLSGSEPDEMTLKQLFIYFKDQKHNQQNVFNYHLAYWQRLVQPITTMVMMLLAIPFIFGPLRSSSMGAKMLAGAIVGFSFHLLNRFFGTISQVWQWPVEVAALAPTILFALLAYLLTRRAS